MSEPFVFITTPRGNDAGVPMNAHARIRPHHPHRACDDEHGVAAVQSDSAAASEVRRQHETAGAGAGAVRGQTLVRSLAETPSGVRSGLARAATTLAAWLVAFGVVMTLLTLFGEELESLPPALRALAISGVLVVLMANLVMPALSVTVARWIAGRPPKDTADEGASMNRSAKTPREHPVECFPGRPDQAGDAYQHVYGEAQQ